MELKNVVNGTYEIVDGVVNVTGYVDFHGRGLTEIPWKFGTVTDGFFCFDNKLTSLKNCPVSVGMNFDCNNNQLTSLKYCPEYIGGDFYCHNNKIESLQYCPVEIGECFCCSSNKLKSLKYYPIVGKIFECSDNPIESFKGVSFDTLMKIYDFQTNFPELTKTITVPVEHYAEIEKLIRDKLRNRGTSRRVSYKKRLDSI